MQIFSCLRTSFVGAKNCKSSELIRQNVTKQNCFAPRGTGLKLAKICIRVMAYYTVFKSFLSVSRYNFPVIFRSSSLFTENINAPLKAKIKDIFLLRWKISLIILVKNIRFELRFSNNNHCWFLHTKLIKFVSDPHYHKYHIAI